MGWRSTIRSIGAAQRRMEREAVRRKREMERAHKQNAKYLQREQAAYQVDLFLNHIQVLRSVHKDCGAALDWRRILDVPAPAEPVRQGQRTAVAERVLASYEPGWLDRLFGSLGKKRAALESALAFAKQQDEAEHSAAVAQHRAQMENWADSRLLAERVLQGDAQAYLDVIEELSPFAEITALGSSVRFRVIDGMTVEAELQVNGVDVLPSETLSLLQSGKLSVKKMPQGQYLELYQDYVCGCVLRVSREVLALLPVETVIVTAVGEILNPATGHIEACAILSAAVPRRTLCRLNFDQLDPSDSLRNFLHRMDFKKGKGFMPVERLQSSDLQLAG